MNYTALPKIDLHCHLDGSVRPETIMDLIKAEGLHLEHDDLSSIKKLVIAPHACLSLDAYLLRFSLPNQVMQTKENIERITFELYEDAALENVKYMEVRFGPLLHTNKGLDLDTIIKSVIKGMRRAEESYDINGNIIITFLRTMATDRIDEVLTIGQKYLNQGICAVDLASSEGGGFCKKFKPYIHKAMAMGYKVTIHAGETGLSQNVSDAILELDAQRIGHGIAIDHDRPVYDLVKSSGTVLEICPTSNVQTKAVENLKSHPINDFYQDQLYITINTDNRTVSATTMTKEIKSVFETFDLTYEDYKKIYKNSVHAAFADEALKVKLMHHLDE